MLKLSQESRAKIMELAAQVKELQTKATAEESGTFEIVISTDSPDRHGDIVVQEGIQIENYMMNPVVLFAHDSCELPIGITTSIRKEAGKTIATGIFAPASVNPFAQQVRGMYDLKMISAASIGFIPLTWEENERGWKILTCDLLEWSFVPTPANAEALRLGIEQMQKKGIDPDSFLKKWLSKSESDEENAEAVEQEDVPAPAEEQPTADKKDAVQDVGAKMTELQSTIDSALITASQEILAILESGQAQGTEGKGAIPSTQKSGRTISQKTLAALRTAHDSMTTATASIKELIDVAEAESEKSSNEYGEVTSLEELVKITSSYYKALQSSFAVLKNKK